MKPKEKAKELVDKFREYCNALEFSNTPKEDETEYSAKAAIVAVDEILNCTGHIFGSDFRQYWVDVKSEIKSMIV